MKAVYASALALLTLLAVAALVPTSVSAQIDDGATMTVLRGQVAVVKTDGSAVQPASSGTVVRVGDEIRTLEPGGAVITFFQGTEVEMGDETALVVRAIGRSGGRVEVSLSQVFGATVSRVQGFTDPSSSYRIEAGGAVAVVRGTTFSLVGPVATSVGNVVVLLCLEDCDPRSTFASCPLGPWGGYAVQVNNGRVESDCQSFSAPRGTDYYTGAFQAVTTIEQQLTNGGNAGNKNLGNSSNSKNNGGDDDDDDNPGNSGSHGHDE